MWPRDHEPPRTRSPRPRKTKDWFSDACFTESLFPQDRFGSRATGAWSTDSALCVWEPEVCQLDGVGANYALGSLLEMIESGPTQFSRLCSACVCVFFNTLCFDHVRVAETSVHCEISHCVKRNRIKEAERSDSFERKRKR